MASESSATTVWEGSLEQGRGEATTASGILDGVEVTWSRRVERTDDTTSPEELLAAAHAACYCMGLSHELDGAGHIPDRLEATAVVSFVPGEGVKSSRLTVRGCIPGIDEAGFSRRQRPPRRAARSRGRFKGNVEIGLEATLES